MVDEVEEAETDEAEDAEVKKKKKPSMTVIIIIVVILASLLSGGMVGLTMYLLSDDDTGQVASPAKAADEDEADDEEVAEEPEEAEEEVVANEGPAQYHRLDPKFVVSFRDQRTARFMQFTIQIMTRDKDVIKQIQEHNPAVRSSLLLLFDSQTAEAMNTREGKVALLTSITEDINRSLEELAGISGVEAAYFESFLIQ